jgi:hypothetical protein
MHASLQESTESHVRSQDGGPTLTLVRMNVGWTEAGLGCSTSGASPQLVIHPRVGCRDGANELDGLVLVLGCRLGTRDGADEDDGTNEGSDEGSAELDGLVLGSSDGLLLGIDDSEGT